MTRYLILLLAISLVGCKSYEFKAKDKGELAELCSKEFTEIILETKTDTTYIDREIKVPFQVDCDSIGQKQIEVPIKWRDRVIKEEVKVRDTSKDFLVLMLEADKVNLQREASRLNQVIVDLKTRHKAELKEANSFKRKVYWGLGILAVGAGLMLYFKR